MCHAVGILTTTYTDDFFGFLVRKGDSVIILHRAVKKLYQFNCPICASKLEATPEELVDIGNKISKFYCPVCHSERYINWCNLRKKIIYED